MLEDGCQTQRLTIFGSSAARTRSRQDLGSERRPQVLGISPSSRRADGAEEGQRNLLQTGGSRICVFPSFVTYSLPGLGAGLLLFVPPGTSVDPQYSSIYEELARE